MTPHPIDATNTHQVVGLVMRRTENALDVYFTDNVDAISADSPARRTIALDCIKTKE